MLSQEACGKLPILTVMHLARQHGWQTRRLDYRNSGDTSGDKSQGVVGYAAIAFYTTPAQAFTPPERRLLVELARRGHQRVFRPVLPTQGLLCDPHHPG